MRLSGFFQPSQQFGLDPNAQVRRVLAFFRHLTLANGHISTGRALVEQKVSLSVQKSTCDLTMRYVRQNKKVQFCPQLYWMPNERNSEIARRDRRTATLARDGQHPGPVPQFDLCSRRPRRYQNNPAWPPKARAFGLAQGQARARRTGGGVMRRRKLPGDILRYRSQPWHKGDRNSSETPPQRITRRDAPVTCASCGRQVKRRGRRQLYCSTRCRKRAHYAES